MKDQILKIAGVKSEKEFYKKYPTEEAFMAKHGKQLKKAAMGTSMVKKQLSQLTDWSNPPVYADGGGIFNVANAIQNAFTTPGKAATDTTAGTPATGGLGDVLGNLFGGTGGAQGIKDAVGASGLLGKGGAGLGSLATKAGLGAAGKAAGLGVLNAAPQILQGIGQMKEQKKQIKKANQMAQISGLTAQAAESRPLDMPKRNYVRPEDALVQPGQLGNPQGTGTNYLAEYGTSISGNPTEIQNTYAPVGDLYADLGYEPINDKNVVKQFAYGGNLPTAEFGDYFQSSGQASIGKGVGSAIGSVFGGPLGGKIGGFVGGVAGNLLGGARDANELARYQDQSQKNAQRAAWAAGSQSIQAQNSAFMEDGGWVSNDWQPQVIATFGEHKLKDLLQPPHDADMLRAGGHLKEYTPPSAEAMFTGRRMEYGGEMAMGGDLRVHRGEAETLSYNPFLPDGGETVMFRGPSHDNGGMPISYGQNGVEVEGGEPAVKLADGGQDENLVVFGNMMIPDYGVAELGDKNAKGKKFKNYVADLSKVEAKQNKLINKSIGLIDESDINNSFDQLTLNSSKLNLLGANMKLKNIAQKKQAAAMVQNAILDTAKEHGLESDALAKGKIVKDKEAAKKAMFGAKLETAGDGSSFSRKGMKNVTPGNNSKSKNKTGIKEKTYNTSAIPFDPLDYSRDIGEQIVSDALRTNYNPITNSDRAPMDYSNFPTIDSQAAPSFTPISGLDVPNIVNLTNQGKPNYNWLTSEQIAPTVAKATKDYVDKTKNKFDWKGLAESALSNVAPLFRPTNQLPLDPSQLMGEQYALAMNQLEPVQAQTFQPMLETTYDISLQDQVNAIDAQANAAMRAAGQNPAAQAQIMAQAADAKNKVLGEQMRINQAQKAQTYAKNREMLNQAQIQKLAIYDKQYERQEMAKSKTKEKALGALQSIDSKIDQNKFENKQLGLMENLYNYRFDPQGRAYNINPLAQINVPTQGSTASTGDMNSLSEYEKAKALTNAYEAKIKSATKAPKSRNGSIVKALKNL